MDCAYVLVNRVNGTGENSNFHLNFGQNCIVRHRSFNGLYVYVYNTTCLSAVEESKRLDIIILYL